MFALSLKFTISCYLLEKWYLKISTQFLFGLSFYGHLKFLGFTGYFCYHRFSNFHRPIISYDIFRRHRMPLSYHNPGGAPKKVKPNEVFYQTFFNKHLQIRKKSIKWVRGNHWPDVIITVSLKKSRSIVRSEKIENMEFGKTLRPLVSIYNDFSVFQT